MEEEVFDTDILFDYNEEFGINSNTIADYGNVLNPDEYEYYDSGISDFNFYYQTNFYNNVTIDVNPNINAYGQNMESVTFSGSDGSMLIYSITDTGGTTSISDMSKTVYNTERSFLVEPGDIMNKTTDSYGKVIVTGWNDSSKDVAIYIMNKIEKYYVVQMKVIFPNYTGEEDKKEKAYFTECLYRLCGFSDSSKDTRTYSEYLEAN